MKDFDIASTPWRWNEEECNNCSGKKLKAVEDEIVELKIKRLTVQTDVDALTKAADDFADKAEKEHKLTW
jgi:hypothetical protein